jgi:hypothetical protein
MFGRQSQLSAREARKLLLVAESELNRAQSLQEWQAMADGIRDLAQRVRTIGAWASAAALLMAGLKAWRNGPLAPAAAKPSWFQKILNAARLASTIWFAFRARREEEEPR